MENKLILRKFVADDAKRLAFLANNKNIWLWLRDGFPHPYSLDDAKAFINNIASNDDLLIRAIIHDGELCGSIGVLPLNDVYRKTAEIGYWVAESFWGRGIATAAISLILEEAKQKYDLVKIFAGTYEGNNASAIVLEKNGFHREAILKKAVFKNGKILDEIRYCLFL